MTETWNVGNPKLTNQLAADVPDIEENFDYIMACHGYWVDSSESDQGSSGSGNSIKDLVDSIGSTKKATLFLKHHAADGNTTTYTLNTSETITSNISLYAMNGAQIAIASGVTLTINGPFHAGTHQVFSCTGTGTVVFGNGAVEKVLPQWFGATADGSTDDTTAIQKAADAVCNAGVNLYFPTGKYKITSSIAFDNSPTVTSIHIHGAGATQVEILNNASDGAFVFNTTSYWTLLHIHDFSITNETDTGAGSYPYMLWCEKGSFQTHIHDMILKGEDYTGGGIYIEDNEFIKINNVYMRKFDAGAGIAFLPTSGDRGNISIDTVQVAESLYGFQFLAGGGAGYWIHCVNLYNFKTVDTTHGVYNAASNLKISNLDIRGCHFEHTDETAGQSITLDLGMVTQCVTIENNFFSRGLIAIDIDNFYNVNIKNNYVFGPMGTFVNVGTHANNRGLIIGHQYYDTSGGAITTKVSDTTSTICFEYYEDSDVYSRRYYDLALINSPIMTLTADNATPSVQRGNVWKTANTVATTITNFTNGIEGQIITVLIQDANTTIDFTGTNLKGNVGVDWSPTTDDHMTCVYDGTDWYCRISDNTA
ncbi:MAG: glycosyl hydrolase family 28-related protein [Candidatus Hodarchaeota archaeon]